MRLPAVVVANDGENLYVSIPLGIAIGLLASCIQSLGLTIQRKSHVLNNALPHHHRKLEHRRPCVLQSSFALIDLNLSCSDYG